MDYNNIAESLNRAKTLEEASLIMKGCIEIEIAVPITANEPTHRFVTFKCERAIQVLRDACEIERKFCEQTISELTSGKKEKKDAEIAEGEKQQKTRTLGTPIIEVPF